MDKHMGNVYWYVDLDRFPDPLGFDLENMARQYRTGRRRAVGAGVLLARREFWREIGWEVESVLGYRNGASLAIVAHAGYDIAEDEDAGAVVVFSDRTDSDVLRTVCSRRGCFYTRFDPDELSGLDELNFKIAERAGRGSDGQDTGGGESLTVAQLTQFAFDEAAVGPVPVHTLSRALEVKGARVRRAARRDPRLDLVVDAGQEYVVRSVRGERADLPAATGQPPLSLPASRGSMDGADADDTQDPTVGGSDTDAAYEDVVRQAIVDLGGGTQDLSSLGAHIVARWGADAYKGKLSDIVERSDRLQMVDGTAARLI